MHSKVQKWGNSLAIRIPKAYAEEALLEEDSNVNIRVEKGKIIFEPLIDKYNLDNLLSQVKEENIHKEYNWGKPTGKELWNESQLCSGKRGCGLVRMYPQTGHGQSGRRPALCISPIKHK